MRLPYSQPVEVDAEEMGSFGNQAFAERRLFYEDVIRRLEQTTSDKALRYEFKDKKTAEHWRASVVNRAVHWRAARVSFRASIWRRNHRGSPAASRISESESITRRCGFT